MSDGKVTLDTGRILPRTCTLDFVLWGRNYDFLAKKNCYYSSKFSHNPSLKTTGTAGGECRLCPPSCERVPCAPPRGGGLGPSGGRPAGRAPPPRRQRGPAPHPGSSTPRRAPCPRRAGCGRSRYGNRQVRMLRRIAKTKFRSTVKGLQKICA